MLRDKTRLEQCILRVEKFAFVQFHYLAEFFQSLQVNVLWVAHDGNAVRFVFDVLFVEFHDVVKGQCIYFRQVFLCWVVCVASVPKSTSSMALLRKLG